MSPEHPITICALDASCGEIGLMFSPMPESWTYPRGDAAADLQREIESLLRRYAHRQITGERRARCGPDVATPERIEADVDALLATWVDRGRLSAPPPDRSIEAARSDGTIRPEYHSPSANPARAALLAIAARRRGP